jgi:hypothetical protein
MKASRGMGAIMPSKMPGKKIIHRKDNPNDVEMYAKGGWIKDAIKKPGALHEQMGIPKGQKIPPAKLAAATKKPGKLGKRARLAETLKGFKK